MGWPNLWGKGKNMPIKHHLLMPHFLMGLSDFYSSWVLGCILICDSLILNCILEVMICFGYPFELKSNYKYAFLKTSKDGANRWFWGKSPKSGVPPQRRPTPWCSSAMLQSAITSRGRPPLQILLAKKVQDWKDCPSDTPVLNCIELFR